MAVDAVRKQDEAFGAAVVTPKEGPALPIERDQVAAPGVEYGLAGQVDLVVEPDQSAAYPGLAEPLKGADRDEAVAAVAHWLKADHPTLGKPTKFEARDGKF